MLYVCRNTWAKLTLVVKIWEESCQNQSEIEIGIFEGCLIWAKIYGKQDIYVKFVEIMNYVLTTLWERNGDPGGN